MARRSLNLAARSAGAARCRSSTTSGASSNDLRRRADLAGDTSGSTCLARAVALRASERNGPSSTQVSRSHGAGAACWRGSRSPRAALTSADRIWAARRDAVGPVRAVLNLGVPNLGVRSRTAEGARRRRRVQPADRAEVVGGHSSVGRRPTEVHALPDVPNEAHLGCLLSARHHVVASWRHWGEDPSGGPAGSSCACRRSSKMVDGRTA